MELFNFLLLQNCVAIQRKCFPLNPAKVSKLESKSSLKSPFLQLKTQKNQDWYSMWIFICATAGDTYEQTPFSWIQLLQPQRWVHYSMRSYQQHNLAPAAFVIDSTLISFAQALFKAPAPSTAFKYKSMLKPLKCFRYEWPEVSFETVSNSHQYSSDLIPGCSFPSELGPATFSHSQSHSGKPFWGLSPFAKRIPG